MFEYIVVTILFLLSGLFAAADQIARYPKRFLPVSRLPERFFTWNTGKFFLYPVNADKTYQGAKIWLITASWYFAPVLPVWIYLSAMLFWWYVIRENFLHRVLTKDRT